MNGHDAAVVAQLVKDCEEATSDGRSRLAEINDEALRRLRSERERLHRELEANSRAIEMREAVQQGEARYREATRR